MRQDPNEQLVCPACRKMLVRNKKLTITAGEGENEKVFHRACFNCHSCKKSLAGEETGGFEAGNRPPSFEHDGWPYCKVASRSLRFLL